MTINQTLKGLLPFQVLLVGDLLIDGVFSLILSGVCLAVITYIEKTVNLILVQSKIFSSSFSHSDMSVSLSLFCL